MLEKNLRSNCLVLTEIIKELKSSENYNVYAHRMFINIISYVCINTK